MDLKRWDIINHLIKKNDYTSYLEIGYYKGWSFDRIECKSKTAVDPNPSQTIGQETMPYGHIETLATLAWEQILAKMTSDDFFSRPSGRGKWDLIFIDGLHESSQVDKDIQNALKHLNPGGTIVMHDVFPPTEQHITGTPNGEWCGDTYKSFIKVSSSNMLEAYTVMTDYGVGIIKDAPPYPNCKYTKEDLINHLPLVDGGNLNYDFLVKGLEIAPYLYLSPEEFLEKEK